MSYQGKFIVIEGPDCSGKTSVAKELAKGGVEVAKATTQVAVENAKTTAAQAVEQ